MPDKKLILQILGVVFILIGLLGFVNDPIMGIFDVDPMHNIVHLLSGGLALWASMSTERNMTLVGQVFAVVYGLVTVLGFVMGEGKLLGLMEVNMADNFLHLILTAAFAYIGFYRPRNIVDRVKNSI